MTRDLMTTTDLAALLGVPTERIRDWQRRGLVTKRGRRGRVNLYDRNEALAVEAAIHRRKSNRRKDDPA